MARQKVDESRFLFSWYGAVGPVVAVITAVRQTDKAVAMQLGAKMYGQSNYRQWITINYNPL